MGRSAKNLSLSENDARLLDLMIMRLGVDALNMGISPKIMGASWLVRALIAYAAERYEQEPVTPKKVSPFSAELLAALERHVAASPEEDD